MASPDTGTQVVRIASPKQVDSEASSVLSNANSFAFMMTPSDSSDSASLPQPAFTVDMLTTLLDRTEDVSRREGVVHERENSLQDQLEVIKKPKDSLDEREQELAFKKLTPLRKLRMAFEQLNVEDMIEAVMTFHDWQMKMLVKNFQPATGKGSERNIRKGQSFNAGQDLENNDKDTSTNLKLTPASATETAKQVNEGVRNAAEVQLDITARDGHSKTINPLGTFASQTSNALPGTASGTECATRFSTTMQGITNPTEKTKQHKNSFSFGSPSMTFNTRSTSIGNFADNLGWVPPAQGVPTQAEREPSALKSIDWRPIYTPFAAPKAATEIPQESSFRRLTADRSVRSDSLNPDQQRQPSWSESFSGASASTSKHARVPLPPTRTWPVETKGPDLSTSVSTSTSIIGASAKDKVSARAPTTLFRFVPTPSHERDQKNQVERRPGL